MRDTWLVTLEEFHNNQIPGSYFVEGYGISEFDSENLHCWIEDPKGILDYDDWATDYEPLYRYSWEEINSLIDMVEDGIYSLPLHIDYGSPRFTKSMVKLMRRQYAIRKAQIKARIQDSKDGVMYDKPIGPKRRRGRPKKYRWEDEVSSSNLEKIYYDLNREVMTVDFHSGATYEYYGVPLKRYRYLKRAKSKGKYFHKKIRFSYPYKRIRG